MYPNVYCNIMYNSPDMETGQVSISRWIIPLYIMEYYSATKKEWNIAICNNMEGCRGHNAKWNKSVKERQILYDFTCMWNLREKNPKEQREKETNQKKIGSSLWGTNWWLPDGRWGGDRWKGLKVYYRDEHWVIRRILNHCSLYLKLIQHCILTILEFK